MNHKISFFALIILIFDLSVLKAQVQLSRQNVFYQYDLTTPVQVQHKIAVGNDSAYVYVKITTPSKASEAYTISYALKESYDGENSTLKGIVGVNDQIAAEGANAFYKIVIPSTGGNAFVLLTITNNAGETYYFDMPIRHEKDFPKTSLLVMEAQREIPVFDDYIHENDRFRVVSFGKEVQQVHFFHYGTAFSPALPPMATSAGKVQKDMTIDSTFSFSTRNTIAIQKRGLYFIQEDSTSLEGISIRVTDRYFPQIARVEEITDPLIYISTAKEIRKLKSAEEIKKGMDRYWLDMTGSPERAKNIIKDYFTQVAKANHLFTTYKEGWKTDQGLVLMIFGNPDEVYKTENAEEWIYNKSALMSKIRFTFAKVKNIFTNQHYDLIRNQSYDKEWFRMVDMWRKGRQEI